MPPPALQPRSDRWWKWMQPKRLRCSVGHQYGSTFRIHDRAARRCEHWIDAEQRECGRWTYFIAMRGGGIIAADVTMEELNQTGHMETTTEVIDFLKIFPD